MIEDVDRAGWRLHRAFSEIGTSRSDNGDGNEDVKKAIGLMTKTTILHVHHTFLNIFFAVTARLRRENA